MEDAIEDAPHRPGEKIYQGAEATLTAGQYLGRLVVVKLRRPKGYRIEPIERALSRSRTRNEAKLLRRAREAGVGVPAVIDADLEEESLTLEYLGRHALRSTFDGLPSKERRTAARAMGAAVGRLHAHGVIHGDLTTSNMIMREGRLHLVDFSLGQVSDKLEDRAVDLKAFKDSFGATHLSHARDFDFVLEGYRRALGPGAAKVIAHITLIERRRRYA